MDTRLQEPSRSGTGSSVADLPATASQAALHGYLRSGDTMISQLIAEATGVEYKVAVE